MKSENFVNRVMSQRDFGDVTNLVSRGAVFDLEIPGITCPEVDDLSGLVPICSRKFCRDIGGGSVMCIYVENFFHVR